MYQDLPLWAYILVTLVLTQVTIASVTIYLHRHQTHRALDFIGRILGELTPLLSRAGIAPEASFASRPAS